MFATALRAFSADPRWWKPTGRAAVTHPRQVALPMLVLQGTRDGLADLALLRGALADAIAQWVGLRAR
jgi:hypothetical protein